MKHKSLEINMRLPRTLAGLLSVSWLFNDCALATLTYQEVTFINFENMGLTQVLSKDGKTLIACNFFENCLVYSHNSTGWAYKAEVPESASSNGFDLAISGDGLTIMLAFFGYNNGFLVYERNDTNALDWKIVQNETFMANVSTSIYFETSVALNYDASIAVIGIGDGTY